MGHSISLNTDTSTDGESPEARSSERTRRRRRVQRRGARHPQAPRGSAPRRRRGGPLPFPGLGLLLQSPIGGPSPAARAGRRHLAGARPTASQRRPPRGARAVATATPPPARRPRSSRERARPPEVGSDPEVSAGQRGSVRSTPAADPVPAPLRAPPPPDRPWTVRGRALGLGRGSGGLRGPFPALGARLPPSPARDPRVWGPGASGQRAPEKEGVAPGPGSAERNRKRSGRGAGPRAGPRADPSERREARAAPRRRPRRQPAPRTGTLRGRTRDRGGAHICRDVEGPV